jgi:hypothetical protein
MYVTYRRGSRGHAPTVGQPGLGCGDLRDDLTAARHQRTRPFPRTKRLPLRRRRGRLASRSGVRSKEDPRQPHQARKHRLRRLADLRLSAREPTLPSSSIAPRTHPSPSGGLDVIVRAARHLPASGVRVRRIAEPSGLARGLGARRAAEGVATVRRQRDRRGDAVRLVARAHRVVGRPLHQRADLVVGEQAQVLVHEGAEHRQHARVGRWRARPGGAAAAPPAGSRSGDVDQRAGWPLASLPLMACTLGFDQVVSAGGFAVRRPAARAGAMTLVTRASRAACARATVNASVTR